MMQRALRTLAETAARAGAARARAFFGTEYDVRLKPDRSEVSEADEAAQVAIIACILEQRAGDSFITEETLHLPAGAALSPPPANDRLCWVIDPIDGTRNFVRHIAVYGCSVAVMRDGYPIASAICDVQRDVLYSGSAQEGFFISGHPITPETDIDRSGLSEQPVVGLPSNPVGVPAEITHRWLDRFICRNFGSAALHLAMVADGSLDGMLADNPRLWDVAGGWVIIRAMGGDMITPDGRPVFPIDVSKYAGEKLPTIAGRDAFLKRPDIR